MSHAARFTYEADALVMEKHLPDVVVLPRSTDEVAALVRWARAHGLPITALDVWLPALYGAAYAAVVLVLAVAIFERRDFR